MIKYVNYFQFEENLELPKKVIVAGPSYLIIMTKGLFLVRL